MPVTYNDIDRLILERWDDVVGLIEAQRSLEDRICETVGMVGERVARWAGPLGFEVETVAKGAEIHAWRPDWVSKKRGPRVYFAVGGFCPSGFRKVQTRHPYLWVYTDCLERYRVKEEERIAFGRSLRAVLGEVAGEWEAHDVEDASAPLGRYLTQYDNGARAKLISDPDALFTFCSEHFPTLFALADTIEAELQRLGR